MNYQAPGQFWAGGPQENDLPPFLQYLNPWYPYPQALSMNMGPPMILAHHMVAAPRQQVAQNNDSSTKELFVSTFWSMFAEEIEALATTHGISSSRRSTKILNGVNEDSIKGFRGKTFDNKTPNMFKILDENENITTKKQVLEEKCREAHCINAM